VAIGLGVASAFALVGSYVAGMWALTVIVGAVT
jgi:hypothetical protein